MYLTATVSQMRGDVRLRSNANKVDYNELCQLLADYLLDRMSTTSPVTPSLSGNALDYALNIIPTTLSGLDVNIDFIKGTFSAAEGSQQGALELFRIANVPIKHGWLAPQEDTDTYDVLRSVAPDYDTAVTKLVEGDELSAGVITASGGGPASPALESVFESLTVDPEKQAKVYQGKELLQYDSDMTKYHCSEHHPTVSELYRHSAHLLRPVHAGREYATRLALRIIPEFALQRPIPQTGCTT